MLYEKSLAFVENISADKTVAGPLIVLLLRLAAQIDESTSLSASMVSEYVRVHTKLLQMSDVGAVDPVEEFLAGL